MNINISQNLNLLDSKQLNELRVNNELFIIGMLMADENQQTFIIFCKCFL